MVGNSHTEFRTPCPKKELLHHAQKACASALSLNILCEPHGGGRTYAIPRPAAIIATHNMKEMMAATLAPVGVFKF